ncbi:MAG TPA: hypothetical protein PLU80_20355, partial [Acidobacteriota bacterium]|nr:hypothetical protein [Acidobacteriota bacterium]
VEVGTTFFGVHSTLFEALNSGLADKIRKMLEFQHSCNTFKIKELSAKQFFGGECQTSDWGKRLR